MDLRQTFRSLAHRNFRLFIIGQGLSLIGTWMQQSATSWVVHEQTHTGGDEPLWQGVVSFSAQIPAFFLAPVAGAVADHFNRRRVILLAQTVMMVQASALAALTLSGQITVVQIALLSVLLGLANAFDMPGRQAFMTEMIDNREDLSNAIALNSSIFNGARLVGPSLAATMLAATNAGFCFLANALSYLAVLWALVLIRVPARPRRRAGRQLLRGVAEGFRYAFGFAPIRTLLLLVAIMGMAGISFTVLLPMIAVKTLNGGVGTFGVLTVASGLGALIGAVYLAARTTVVGLGRWTLAMSAVAGVGLIAFSFSEKPWIAAALLIVIGFALMVQMGATNIILQTIVDDDKRGRVMSLYVMSFLGMAPLGALLTGVLANQFGPAAALRVNGALCLAGSLAFAFQFRRIRAHIRPIYVRLGILPEMTSSVYPALSPPAPNTAMDEPNDGEKLIAKS
jgi:MFS family permease